MWKNYLKTSFRNLLRHKGYTLINLLGLSSGMAVSIFILLWILDEVSYDRFWANSDRIHSVMIHSEMPDGSLSSHPVPTASLKDVLLDEIPEIEAAARYSFETDLLVKNGQEGFNETGIFADPAFFEVFQLPFSKGNPGDLNTIVLSEELAAKLFPQGNPVGKTVSLNQNHVLTVAGVFENLPTNSSLQFDFIAPFELYLRENPWMENWQAGGSRTAVLLRENSQLPNAKLSGLIQANCSECSSTAFLYPYAKLRLEGRFENGVNAGGRIEQVYLFGFVALLILVMACINFINLATARSGTRGREVGIRKSIGAQRGELVLQFVMESMLLSWIALLFAVLLVQLLLPFFNEVTQKSVDLDLTNPSFLIGTLSITLMTGLLSGSYPAFVLSGFNPMRVLKGDSRAMLSGSSLRRVLVVAQFATSAILVVGSIAIYQQIRYIGERNLGFEKENILVVDQNEGIVRTYAGIKNDLLQLPGVENIAFGGNSIFSVPITSPDPVWPGKPQESTVNFKIFRCDEGFLPTLGIPLAEGRNFLGVQDGANYIINKKAAEVMGLDPETAVGTPLEMWQGKGQIVGVTEDFHNDNLRLGIEPMVFMYSQNVGSYYFIKVSEQSPMTATIAQIQSVFKKHNPDYPFEFSFLEEVFDREYQNEQVIGRLALAFTCIAVLISGLGLFGLASFTAAQRTKEIGIRKVLGASAGSLSLLLCGDFAILVLASLAIGFPVAWYFVGEFLEGFTYHTEIRWTLYLLTAMLMLGLTLLSVGYHTLKAAWTNPVDSLQNEG
ncbi:ABC transporter permease [Algoriphagus sp. H41]|uniref:ABC transporter permease n=1 Tax=Algoriphagus oliviformis TaxID=2811231 RepID=A0ABS3C622_9BACT|nr:ABC transporter permease [Algoriphagus oliviformis]MBN7812570.1 ABC transporter permease [Algoriphagus oliviformis]